MSTFLLLVKQLKRNVKEAQTTFSNCLHMLFTTRHSKLSLSLFSPKLFVFVYIRTTSTSKYILVVNKVSLHDFCPFVRMSGPSPTSPTTYKIIQSFQQSTNQRELYFPENILYLKHLEPKKKRQVSKEHPIK